MRRTALALAAALLAAAPAAAQTATDATWYIDGSNPGVLPQHFELAPRNPGLVVKTIASAVLLPNVLVTLDQAAVHSDGRTYSPPGGQAFRVAHEALPTYCPIDRIGNVRFYCLIDTDGDGALDSDVKANALVLAPRIFKFDAKSIAKLAQPVRFTAIDRSASHYRLPIELVYTGWNGWSGPGRPRSITGRCRSRTPRWKSCRGTPSSGRTRPTNFSATSRPYPATGRWN